MVVKWDCVYFLEYWKEIVPVLKDTEPESSTEPPNKKKKKNLYNVVFCIVGNEEMLVKQSPVFNEHHFRYNL